MFNKNKEKKPKYKVGDKVVMKSRKIRVVGKIEKVWTHNPKVVSYTIRWTGATSIEDEQELKKV